MSVGLKVTVYNESGAFLAAGWKKHSGYTSIEIMLIIIISKLNKADIFR